MRVALLEVVHRAVHEVLDHLLPGALVAQVVGGTLTVDGLDRELLHLGLGGLVLADLADIVAHRAQERLLEASAQVQQRRVPLPSRIHSGKTAVMQFIADVEGKLKVEAVGGVGLAHRNIDRPHVQCGPTSLKEVDYRGGQRPDGLRQRRFDKRRRKSHAHAIPESGPVKHVCPPGQARTCTNAACLDLK